MSAEYTYKGLIAATAIVSLYPDTSGNFWGDGTADDVEIQAAITWLGLLFGGGWLHIKYGSYDIAATVNIQYPIDIFGDGMASTLLTVANGVNGHCFNFNPGATIYHPVIQDLKIDHNGGNQTVGCCINANGDTVDGQIFRVFVNRGKDADIWLDNAWGWKITHCVIENSFNVGVRIEGGSQWYLTDNFFGYHLGIALQTNTGRTATIKGNVFNSCQNHGIYLNRLDQSSIVGNMFYACGTDNANTYDAIFFGNTPEYNTITGNTILGENLTRYGLNIVTGIGTVVSSNIIHGVVTDGIYVATAATDTSIVGSIISSSGATGVNTDGFRTVIDSNFLVLNGFYGLEVDKGDCTVRDNFVYDNGQSSAGTYHGILISANGLRAVIEGNYSGSPGDSQEDGIFVYRADNCIVSGNYCFNGMGSGISLMSHADSTFVHGNYCSLNDDYGIENQGTENWIRDNYLTGNVTNNFSDTGTNTKLETIPLYIASYNVTDVSESEDGLVVDGAGEWVSFVGQLPLHVQQVVRFEIWAVGLAAPGAGNQMCLTIEIEGGAEDEGKATHDTGALAGQLNTTEATAVDDIIHWICINANALALLGGDSVKCACRYNAAVASDIATNAAFRRVLAHIV